LAFNNSTVAFSSAFLFSAVTTIIIFPAPGGCAVVIRVTENEVYPIQLIQGAGYSDKRVEKKLMVSVFYTGAHKKKLPQFQR